MKKKLFIVVNVDWFFLSHRLPIALAAKEAGYLVTIVASDTGRSAEIIDHGLNFIEVPFQRSGTNVLYEFKCLNMLRAIYSKHKPDIVHHVTIKVALYGSIAAKVSNIKGVVNAISGLGYNFTGDRVGILQVLLINMMRYGFRGKKTKFIFQNNDDIDAFKKLNIVEDSQVCLIKGSGVDLDTFRESDFPKDGKISVLFAARMLYDKGVMEYIKAAGILKEEFEFTAKFLLAGDVDKGNLASLDLETLKSLTDGEYICWIGHQTDIYRTLREAHIVVLPSYREGLPKSLIEAAAVGRPIITTDVPGCRECVIDGYNGFVVESKNSRDLAIAIKKLLQDQTLRAVLGHNSRLLAEREFSIENVITKTLGLYDSFNVQH